MTSRGIPGDTSDSELGTCDFRGQMRRSIRLNQNIKCQYSEILRRQYQSHRARFIKVFPPCPSQTCRGLLDLHLSTSNMVNSYSSVLQGHYDVLQLLQKHLTSYVHGNHTPRKTYHGLSPYCINIIMPHHPACYECESQCGNCTLRFRVQAIEQGHRQQLV